MYILYLDESGDPAKWHEQNNFVLAGLAVHEGQIYGLSKQLDAIQTRFFPQISPQLPFHATDVRNGKGHFRDLSPEKREELMAAVYGVIGQTRFPLLVAFGTTIDISAAQDADANLEAVLADITSRFDIFMRRGYRRGHQNKGLLIIDQAHQERYRALMASFQSDGTRFGYFENVVDIPYFAGRRDTRMLQLADFCAYAVYRYYEAKDDRYINQIVAKFDRRAQGTPPDGLKHITKQPCQCIACNWRRQAAATQQ